MKKLVALMALAAFMAVTSFAFAEVDKGPAEITIHGEKKGDLVFNHAAHQASVGEDKCEACHHTGMDKPNCKECHNVDPAISNSKVAYHKQCKSCHKKAGMKTGCSTCH